MPGAVSQSEQIAAVRETLEIFHRPGDVVEVRVIGLPGKKNFSAAGYFDDFQAAAEAAVRYDLQRNARGVYFAMNRCDPALLARSLNHITDYQSDTTKDHDITRRRWLLIDVDPKRPTGIGSTAKQLHAAEQLAESVREWLAEQGWPEPVEAMSGNGKHLLYPIDLPNDDESRWLIETVLKALGAKFSTSDVSIDLAVFNAARITKLYGTTVRKGDSTPDRPHRRSELTYIPDYIEQRQDEPFSIEPFQAVVAMLPKDEPPPKSHSHNGNHRLDVARWLRDRGVEFVQKPSDNGRAIFAITCPFNPEHRDDANVTQFDSGAMSASCFHNSCQGRAWAEIRDAIGKPDADHFDPPLFSRNGTSGTDDGRRRTVNGTGPRLSRMSTVEPQRVTWLWPRRIPIGCLTLLVGRPGEGKSFLTCDLASRVSTGTPWPDGEQCDRGDTLLVTAEDGEANTIRPRLDAHRADCSRVHHMSTVVHADDDGTLRETLFSLANIDDLRAALDKIPECRLVVIDPIGSFIGGRTDAHRDNEVRSVLAPLAALAEEYAVAILLVLHNRKAVTQYADDAALGSRAFTGIARAVWHLTRDTANKNRRLFLPGKCNLAEQPAGLAFAIAGDPASLHWEFDPVVMTADDRMQQEHGSPGPDPDARSEAEDFLRQALASAPRPAKELTEEAREAYGITTRTLKRARKSVGVEAFREKIPGPWFWRLPKGATHH